MEKATCSSAMDVSENPRSSAKNDELQERIESIEMRRLELDLQVHIEFQKEVQRRLFETIDSIQDPLEKAKFLKELYFQNMKQDLSLDLDHLNKNLRPEPEAQSKTEQISPKPISLPTKNEVPDMPGSTQKYKNPVIPTTSGILHPAHQNPVEQSKTEQTRPKPISLPTKNEVPDMPDSAQKDKNPVIPTTSGILHPAHQNPVIFPGTRKSSRASLVQIPKKSFIYIVCSRNNIDDENLKMLYMSPCSDKRICSAIKQSHFHFIYEFNRGYKFSFQGLYKKKTEKNYSFRVSVIERSDELRELIEKFKMIKTD